MTLTEARRTLGARKTLERLTEAIRVVTAALPDDEGGRRATAAERLAEIRAGIRDAKGFDPFDGRSKTARDVVWRQCVFCLMRDEGYTLQAIGDAAPGAYNHATVLCGERRVRNAAEAHDRDALDAWRELGGIVAGLDSVRLLEHNGEEHRFRSNHLKADGKGFIHPLFSGGWTPVCLLTPAEAADPALAALVSGLERGKATTAEAAGEILPRLAAMRK